MPQYYADRPLSETAQNIGTVINFFLLFESRSRQFAYADNEAKEVDDVEVVNGYIVGQQPATEPTYVQGVLIVNKKNPLPPTYNKGEDPKAKAAFEKMAAAAKNGGFEIVAFRAEN